MPQTGRQLNLKDPEFIEVGVKKKTVQACKASSSKEKAFKKALKQTFLITFVN